MRDPRIITLKMRFNKEIIDLMIDMYGFDIFEAMRLHMLSFNRQLETDKFILDMSVSKKYQDPNNIIYGIDVIKTNKEIKALPNG